MKYLLVIIFVFLSGCATSPFRVGQDTVRQPVRDVITEDIRQGADYLAREVNETPQKEVAISLSQRVGSPDRPIDNPDRVQSNLAKGQKDYRDEIERLNAWLEKRAGVKLEGTGINLLGIGGIFLVIGIIIALILVPAFIPLFISIIRSITGAGYSTLKHTSRGIVKAIEEYKSENPSESKKLLEKVSKNLDEKDKILIEKFKRE